MGKMNWKRILLGGLLAGVLSVVLGASFAHLMFQKEIDEAFRRFNITPGPGMVVLHVSMRLVLGMGVVWLYAAIRPRFGPGPRAAIIAAVFVWLFSFVFGLAGSSPYGLHPARVTFIMIGWGLPELALCALAGAWAYRE